MKNDLCKKAAILDPTACIHCHKCRQQCLFLDKYKIDIGDSDRLRELAYHCFLCGRCSEVCPKGIDGRGIILAMRQEEIRKNCNKLTQKGYGMLLFEKEDYIYKNYRRGKKKSVIFPGCNYPSFYPKTTEKLAAMLLESADMGIVYDCCGKPVAELGLEKKEEKILSGIESRMRECKVEEIVTLCPNCYHYLKPKIGIKLISIYEKLRELGIGRKLSGEFPVFLPCPDKEPKNLYKDIEFFIDGDIKEANKAQCCGLGGCACVKESDLAYKMACSMKENEGQVYTYCATCAGNLERKGCAPLKHILNEIIGSDEKAALKTSMINRAMTKFK